MKLTPLLFNKLLIIPMWFLGMLCSLADAGTVAQEQDKLARFEQAYENHLVAIEDIENEIFGYDYKLKDARKDEQEAEQALTEAKQALEAAQQAVKSNASDDNRRALSLAAHAYKMADRGVRSRHRRLERIESNMAELQASLEKEKVAADTVKQRIAAQERRVAQAVAALERRASQALATKKSLAPPVANSNAPRPAPARPEPVPGPQPAPEKPELIVETDVAGGDLDEISELDQQALEYARREIERLEALTGENDDSKPTFRHLMLKGSEERVVSFEFMGRNQYRAEATVSKGKQLFEVGNRKFRRTIPESDDGEVYVFIYDARRLSRPRLVMFKKSLMEFM